MASIGLPFKRLIINSSVVRFLGFAINLEFGLFQFVLKSFRELPVLSSRIVFKELVVIMKEPTKNQQFRGRFFVLVL
jgi:hypothetical protein